MDFSLTDAQTQMQTETGRALEGIASMARVRAASLAPGAVADDVVHEVRRLGLSGLMIEERFGGLGLGLLDAAIVAEQLGRYVVPAPYLATSVMAPLAIALAGSEVQKAELLPRLADGSLIAAVGISEFASGGRAGNGIDAAGGRLSGSTIFVIDSAGAEVFVLADRLGALHVVRHDAPGVCIVPLDTVDRTRSVCKLELSDVTSDPLATHPQNALARMRDAGRVILAADTLGAASRMLEKAVDYAGQRRQFGRVIGSFQAVKHICADMAAELEPGRALVWYAAYAQDVARDDACLASLHAKAYLSDAGRMVARKATEVHGGIGITDELGLHYWFKRIGWNHQLLGAPDHLREEAARVQGLVPA